MFPHCGNAGCHTRMREGKSVAGHEWYKQTTYQQKQWAVVIGWQFGTINVIQTKKQGKVEQNVTRATAVLRGKNERRKKEKRKKCMRRPNLWYKNQLWLITTTKDEGSKKKASEKKTSKPNTDMGDVCGQIYRSNLDEQKAKQKQNQTQVKGAN